eukprot:COSAG02_NODE_4989_length_4744_cov_12.764693_2_plen_658_part_00
MVSLPRRSGVSICLATPVQLGWQRLGGVAFQKGCGDELWGSKWYEVMSGSPPADLKSQISRNQVKGTWPAARDEWGSWSKKLEVCLVVRIPSPDNRDPRRIVPGRDNVLIIPPSDCVFNENDQASYLSNTLIEKVLLLKPPAGEAGGTTVLDALATKNVNAQVRITSERDERGGMTEVKVTHVSPDVRIEDVLRPNPKQPWCPSVVKCTASVTRTVPASQVYLDRHRQIEKAGTHKQVWPENIARFTTKEMKAALQALEQAQLQSYVLCYHYCSAEAARCMCEIGRGLDADCSITTLSPSDLLWEKYAGGTFRTTAGESLWGVDWEREHKEDLQACLVIGLPNIVLQNQGVWQNQCMNIPEELLTSDHLGNDKAQATKEQPKVYSNAFVYKSYVLQAQGSASVSSTGARVARVANDFDGAGADHSRQVTQEEAMASLVTQGYVASELEGFMVGFWTACDEDQNGTLDADEFVKFMNVVTKKFGGAKAKPVAGTPQPETADGGMSNPLFTPGSSGAITQVPNSKPLPPVWKPPSLETIFREIDADRSGQLEIDEFKDWWRQNDGDQSQVPLFEQCFELIGACDGVPGVSLLEFKEVIAAVAANDWVEKRSEAHNRAHWWNQRTGKSSWTDPSGPDQVEATVEDWLQRMGVKCYETLKV